MYCGKCGSQIPAGNAFCTVCGETAGTQNQNSQNFNQAHNQGQNNDKNYMGIDYTSSFDSGDIAANKVISLFAYLFFLFFIPLVAAPNSKFGRFHANQGLINFLLWVACGILNTPFTFIFWGFNPFSIIYLAPLGFTIYGIINAVNGKAVELPVIGKLRIIT